MMMCPGSGDLSLEIKYGPGDGNSVETYLIFHANQGLKVNSRDAGYEVRLTIFGEWERSALHEMLSGHYTRKAANNRRSVLETELAEMKLLASDSFVDVDDLFA
ncbi:MAG: hypothetical protein ACPGC3_04295 [Paracoccaceae bacterium]